MVESSPDAQVAFDGDGVIAHANAAAHAMFGYQGMSLRGRPIGSLILPGPYPATCARAEERQGTPAASRKARGLKGLRSDGSEFPVHVLAAPVAGVPGVTIAAIRDASDDERLLGELVAARRAAEAASEAKDRLLAAASHDLRQPLQAIHLIHGVLRRKLAGSGLEDILAEESQAIEAMSQLLHALLNIARLESGRVQPVLAEIPVRKLLGELHGQFNALAAAKALALEVSGDDLHVHTDRLLLSELLQNLLANAIRYTDAGTVSLSCRRYGELVRLEVADTGIGIAEAVRQRIFEDFFQASPRGNDHRGGTGLGLGIVRRIAALLGIGVTLQSMEGQGTRFMVDVAAALPASQPQPAEPPVQTPPRERRVLLVEDDAPLRAALTLYLRLHGHDVLSAGSLRELAVIIGATASPPDLVITDFQLGEHERGSDAIEAVQQRFSTPVPTIVLTGDTSAVPAHICQREGVLLLNKPIDGAGLMAAVSAILAAA